MSSTISGATSAFRVASLSLEDGEEEPLPPPPPLVRSFNIQVLRNLTSSNLAIQASAMDMINQYDTVTRIHAFAQLQILLAAEN